MAPWRRSAGLSGTSCITKIVESEMRLPLEFLGELLPKSSRAEIDAWPRWLRPDYVVDGTTTWGVSLVPDLKL